MLRVSSCVGLLLLLLTLTSTLVGPVGAVNAYRFQLEPGSHEFVMDGHRMVIETRRTLEVHIYTTDGILQGMIEAANSDGTHVRIIRLGPPDVVIFDGSVTNPVIFHSSGSDETGHAEL